MPDTELPTILVMPGCLSTSRLALLKTIVKKCGNMARVEGVEPCLQVHGWHVRLQEGLSFSINAEGALLEGHAWSPDEIEIRDKIFLAEIE